MKGSRDLSLIALIACCFIQLPCMAQENSGASPRYTMPSGRGWSVCEAYLKFLNALPITEETLTCDLKVQQVPGMRYPVWHELDVSQNLDVIHQIEVLLGVGHIEPEPDKDFERWKRQREARMKANGEQPRLQKAHLALAANGAVETVLSYNYDIKMCEKELRAARAGKPYAHQLGEPNFFVYDEAKRKVLGSGYWVVLARGELVLFQGKPYYIELGFGSYDGAGTTSGGVRIKRLEPVTFSEVRELSIPNNPLYESHELCRIRFDYPFPRFNPPALSR